jgi:peptidoglycan glycosyltransferase
MNRQIARLAVVALVLITALIGGTTYWQTWAAAGLADRQDNAIQRVAQFTIKRGKIKAADGTVLAANYTKRVEGHTLYFRRYPTGGLFAQLVGYSTQVRSRAGLERSENDFLTASNANLGTIFDKTIDKLKGTTVTGNDLVLTVRTRLQRLAMQQLAGKCGAAVALDPRSGKVLALASQPTYDPNLVERRFNRIPTKSAACPGAAPLVERATDGLFTPGSTFKVVTATAALDTGRFTPDSPFYDPGYCIEYGKQVSNAGSPDQGGAEVFGNVTLALGLVHSINSVYCNIAKELGAKPILDYAKRFGFYALPPLETPGSERAPSGLYDKGKLYWPKNFRYDVDPGRIGFGQERLQVTPLQMAMIGAAVAHGGVLMRPYVVDRAVAANGDVVMKTHPKVMHRVMKTQTAQEITSMMVGAVDSGTGTAAQIPGVQVAGKTGTAETGVNGRNTAWFMCFAPADHPRFVVAVVLENQTGFGGQVAAPIAKVLMQALLAGGSKS